MRYPISKNGTKDEYQKDWYDAQGFGIATSYGLHEGRDFNLKTGGDSDLGQPLYAVSNGKIVYYHNSSHPTTGFGKHMVLECDTTLGKRWFHYAHCDEITAQAKNVTEGEIIGKLGKSGTTYAHLHFAVFKTEPSELRNGIDTVAKNKTELDNWWEDPFITLDSISTISNDILPKWFETLLQEWNLTISDESKIREIFERAKKYPDETNELKEQIKSVNEALSSRAMEVSLLTEKNQKLSDRVDELQELYDKARAERDTFSWGAEKLQIEVKILEEDKTKLQKQIELLQTEKEALKIDVERLKNKSVNDISTGELFTILINRIFSKEVK